MPPRRRRGSSRRSGVVGAAASTRHRSEHNADETGRALMAAPGRHSSTSLVRPHVDLTRMLTRPPLGFGLGLRVEHYDAILSQRPNIDWLEALTENYLVPGGKPLHYLTRIRE